MNKRPDASRTPTGERFLVHCFRIVLLPVLLTLSCRPGGGPTPTPTPTPRGRTTASSPFHVVKTTSGIEMIAVPAGWFEMGSNDGENDEKPARKVWVDAFLMDRFEMTQDQFAKFAAESDVLSTDPSHFKGAKRPVEMVSWDIAALACNQRSVAEGLEPCYDDEGKCHFDATGYRLPTEAEWEYACRAGTKTAYFFGDDLRRLGDYAWYAGNAGKQTHPVGRKKPNPWGLYDMLGNVAEWCNDFYAEDAYRRGSERNPRGPVDGTQVVLRGGSWNSSAAACRSAYRVGEASGMRDACFARDAIGFRCVRRPSPPTGETGASKNTNDGSRPTEGDTP